MTIKATMQGENLILTINTSKDLGLSKTGRSIIVETTGGWEQIPGTDLALNLYLVRSLPRREPKRGTAQKQAAAKRTTQATARRRRAA